MADIVMAVIVLFVFAMEAIGLLWPCGFLNRQTDYCSLMIATLAPAGLLSITMPVPNRSSTKSGELSHLSPSG
jgi:hypothetical protein